MLIKHTIPTYQWSKVKLSLTRQHWHLNHKLQHYYNKTTPTITSAPLPSQFLMLFSVPLTTRTISVQFPIHNQNDFTQ